MIVDEASAPSTTHGQNTQRQPQHRDLMVLDNACGSSALVTSHLIDSLPFELLEESQFIATDLSSKCVREATRRIAEGDWADHVFTYIMDQQVSFIPSFLSFLQLPYKWKCRLSVML